MANNFPPTVIMTDKTVELGERLPIHTMFSVTDIDPDSEVTKYRFRDTTTTPQSGFFTLFGVPQQQGLWFEIDANLLFEIHYQASVIISSETLQIQAFDGLHWSAAANALAYSVKPNVAKPIVSLANFDALATEAVDMVNFVSASDPDGYPIVKYLFVDRRINGNGGHFLFKGQRMQSAKWFEVLPGELNQLKYVGARFEQNEGVGVQVSDGKFWSGVVNANAHTTPNLFAPVLTANNVSVLSGSAFDADRLFDFTDQDGNTLKSVSFMDLGAGNNTGYFEVNGVKKLPNQWFTVPIGSIGNVKYIGGDAFTLEGFMVKGHDGTYESAAVRGDLTSVAKPELMVSEIIYMMDELETVELKDLVTNSPGPSILEYQVIDLNDIPSSAKLRRNGIALAPHEVHTLTANQFSQVILQAAPDDLGRSFDNFLVRASNGFAWSTWERINVSTDPVNQDGVLDIGQWNSGNGQPVTVTYNFPAQVPWYYCNLGLAECGTFIPMDPARRAAVRDVMEMYMTMLNITFVEVPSSSIGDITFADLPDPGDGLLGYSYGVGKPGQTNNPNQAILGDIWITQHPLNAQLDPDLGEGGWTTLVHEVGHSLGLKHSFQGTPVLPPAMESNQYSMMSYNRFFGQFESATPMLYDLMALQHLYGANTNFNSGDTQIRLEKNEIAPQVFWDGGGIDSLNFSHYTVNVTLNLQQGQFSSTGTLVDNMAVPWGVDIENARGGIGDDTLIGNDLDNLLWGNVGRDIFQGNGGNDFLRGGKGNDTYRLGIGDGWDLIDEEKLAGRDTLEVHGFGTFNALEDDFTFRRLGRDLRLDLSLDQGNANGGVTIRNMKWGGSRVETLKMFDVEGEQIGEDIDLNSIFQVATNAPQRFMVSNATSKYGYLAVPV